MHMMMAFGLDMYCLHNLIISSLVVAAIPVVTVYKRTSQINQAPAIISINYITAAVPISASYEHIVIA